eukprot:Rhum_TRINITY_DN14592_c6_g2::Rhum_TRINITY_DN14592_c6_g2_i1::g.100505::m.100505
MPLPARRADAAGSAAEAAEPKASQLHLLESQRRWVAGMVARGHTSDGWFRLKERALTMHQKRQANAVDGDGGRSGSGGGGGGGGGDVEPALLSLLHERSLRNWSKQLEDVGITSLAALRSVMSEGELPPTMPAPSRRVLMAEVLRLQQLHGSSGSSSGGQVLPPQQQQLQPSAFRGVPRTAAPAPVSVSPQAAYASASAATPAQSPQLSAHSAYDQQPVAAAPQHAASHSHHHHQQQQPSPPIRPSAVVAATPAGHHGPSADTSDGNLEEKVIRPPPPEAETGGIYGVPQHDEAAPPVQREACGVNCTRKFAADRIEAHRRVCANAKQRKRFDIASKRVTDEAKQVIDEGGNDGGGGGGAGARRKPAVNKDEKAQCPHCSRSFAPDVAANHMPGCAERARRKPKKPGVGATTATTTAAAAAAASGPRGRAGASPAQQAPGGNATAPPSFAPTNRRSVSTNGLNARF